jgi:hypothetical protein
MKLWFHREGIWLCAPPKCGGTMLYRNVLGIQCADHRATFSTAQSVIEFRSPDGIGRPAYLAVRDPVDRFMSLWRDKCRDGDPNMPKLHGLTPDDLLTVIENDWLGDAHWAPQAIHYRPGVHRVPFHQLVRWFQPLLASAIPVNSTTLTSADPQPPTARILHHYWKDVELVYG